MATCGQCGEEISENATWLHRLPVTGKGQHYSTDTTLGNRHEGQFYPAVNGRNWTCMRKRFIDAKTGKILFVTF